MQDLDTVAETVRIFIRHVTSGKHSQNQGLSGRAVDLKSAYKQLASNPKDAWASILRTWDPEKSLGHYRFATLPFGSSHSVTAFNRIGSALRKILIRLMKLVVTNLYDDFC